MSSKLLAKLLQRKQEVAASTNTAVTAITPAPTAKPAAANGAKPAQAQTKASQPQQKQPPKQQQQQQQQPQQPQAKQPNVASNPSTSQKKQKKRKQPPSGGAADEDDTMSDAAPAPPVQQGQSKKAKTQTNPPTPSRPAPKASAVAGAPAPHRKLSALQQKMASKLAGGRFRWLNEKLYTCTGAEAYEYFQAHPDDFDEYHKGFGVQVVDWPVSPLDQFIMYLRERPTLVAGDFGCGEARLAESVDNQVHSFDLVAHNDRVTACNMTKVPLKDGTLDVAIFCLSLMGVDFMAFIREAHRTLKMNGILLIAEVRSRFEESGIDVFISAVQEVGFHLRRKDVRNQMFATLEFQKNKGTATVPKNPTAIAAAAAAAAEKSKSTPHKGAGGKQGGKFGGKASNSYGKDKAKSSLSAKQASTHPVAGKKGDKRAVGAAGDAPMLTACIYKKR